MQRCPECKSNTVSMGRAGGVGFRGSCLQCGFTFPAKPLPEKPPVKRKEPKEKPEA